VYPATPQRLQSSFQLAPLCCGTADRTTHNEEPVRMECRTMYALQHPTTHKQPATSRQIRRLPIRWIAKIGWVGRRYEMRKAHAAIAICCCCTRSRSKNDQQALPSQIHRTRSIRYSPTRRVDPPDTAYASGTRSTQRRLKPGIGHPCTPKKKNAYLLRRIRNLRCESRGDCRRVCAIQRGVYFGKPCAVKTVLGPNAKLISGQERH
jgi:hypothetical protein